MQKLLNDDEKRNLLKEMFLTCDLGSNEFAAKRFRVTHQQHRDKIDELEESHFIERSSSIYKLRLIALAELEESVPECKTIIDVCELIFNDLKREYLQEPEQTLQLINIAYRYNLDPMLIRIATPYLLQASIFSSYGDDEIAGACVTTREDILDYENFRQCIERLQGYSLSRPENLVAQSNTTSFEANLMDIAPLLHPNIIQHAYQHYQSSHYREAVLNSIMALSDMIRGKTKLEEDGDRLVCKAFSPENPYLKINDISTESGKNDQTGFMQMLQGAYKGIRNPNAHTLDHDLDELKAAQYLVFASLLARRIEEAEIVQTYKKDAA
jgi:uncharacterized protein (TIGR02391 family)